jgi:WD40 repeat protein
LFAANDDGTGIVVHNLYSGQESIRVPYRNDWDYRPRFRPLGGRLAIRPISETGLSYEVWDMTTGKRAGKEGLVLDDDCWTWPTVSSADERIIACTTDTNIHIVELSTGEMRTISVSPRWRIVEWRRATMSPDGRRIAVPLVSSPTIDQPRFLKRRVELFDTATGEALGFFPKAHCAAFSYDGKTVAVANPDGQIELWDLGTFPIASTPVVLFTLVASAVAVVTFAIAMLWNRRRKATKTLNV